MGRTLNCAFARFTIRHIGAPTSTWSCLAETSPLPRTSRTQSRPFRGGCVGASQLALPEGSVWVSAYSRPPFPGRTRRIHDAEDQKQPQLASTDRSLPDDGERRPISKHNNLLGLAGVHQQPICPKSSRQRQQPEGLIGPLCFQSPGAKNGEQRDQFGPLLWAPRRQIQLAANVGRTR